MWWYGAGSEPLPAEMRRRRTAGRDQGDGHGGLPGYGGAGFWRRRFDLRQRPEPGRRRRGDGASAPAPRCRDGRRWHPDAQKGNVGGGGCCDGCGGVGAVAAVDCAAMAARRPLRGAAMGRQTESAVQRQQRSGGGDERPGGAGQGGRCWRGWAGRRGAAGELVWSLQLHQSRE